MKKIFETENQHTGELTITYKLDNGEYWQVHRPRSERLFRIYRLHSTKVENKFYKNDWTWAFWTIKEVEEKIKEYDRKNYCTV